jgi:hypothetical protein
MADSKKCALPFYMRCSNCNEEHTIYAKGNAAAAKKIKRAFKGCSMLLLFLENDPD